MLTAYVENGEVKIKAYSSDELGPPAHMIETYVEALRILSEASSQRPEVDWVIAGDGNGPWGVHQKT